MECKGSAAGTRQAGLIDGKNKTPVAAGALRRIFVTTDIVDASDKKSIKTLDIKTFEQLIEFLKSRNNDLEKAFPASIDTDLQGRPVKFMREQAACAAWEIAFRAVIQADRNRVFISDKNMKTVSANLRDLYSLMNYLDESTGCESRLSLQHLALALEALHRHGDLDKRPEMAKLRGIVRLAEEIWKPEAKHVAFVAELARQCELSERHIYRYFKTMKKLPEFKTYPWLNSPKSVDTSKKSKRKDIALNAKR